MSELDAFETRFADAYRRYLDGAPSEIDAAGVARSVVADQTRGRDISWLPFGRMIPGGIWLLVLAALLGALLGGAYLVGARHPIVSGQGCPSSAKPDVAGPTDQGRPPADFLRAAFDRQTGQIVAVATEEAARAEDVGWQTWTFDVCANLWTDRGSVLPAGDPWVQLVYAEDPGVTVAFTGNFGTVWTFDTEEGVWTQVADAPSDEPVRAAYDPRTAQVIAQPIGPSFLDGQLWTYDARSDSWATRAATGGAGSRQDADHLLMAYDRSVDRIVANTHTLTQLFDPATASWSDGAPGAGINTGYFASGGEIAYHEADGRTVIFSDRDVLAYDAIHDEWERLHGSGLPGDGTGPAARLYHAMVYDSWNERLVVLGGDWRTSTGWQTGNDVITFDLTTRAWTQLLGPAAGSE